MKRFKCVYRQHLSGGIVRIFVDTETGVNYVSLGGFSPSMTPLLNEKGEVVISKL